MGFYFNTNSITPSGGSGGGGSGGDAVWGAITGTLSNQTDLQTALNAKVNNTSLATVATTGAYSDLSGTPTIPTVNNATLTITQGGQTIATFSANASQDVTANIQAESSGLQNTATYESSLTVEGTPSNYMYSTNIGINSVISNDYGTAIGNNTQAAQNGIAIGYNAHSTDIQAYQIGSGYNNDAQTLKVGWGNNYNYTLLDSLGKIPAERLPDINIENKNTTSGATNPLQFWEGTEQEYNIGGGQKDLYYNWEYMSSTQTTLPEANKWETVCFGNGRFVALNGTNLYNTGAYSDDGITWTSMQLPNTMNCTSVVYGNNKFVAVTRGYGSDPNYSGKAIYSSDGVTWQESDMPSTQPWTSVTYGNGKFVAVCEQLLSLYAYSDDGINWTKGNLPDYLNWSAVTFGNGRFVAVAKSTTNAAYSDDGINWTRTTMPSSKDWSNITYGNGIFVAVADGNNNCIAYSNDNGVTWTETGSTNYQYLKGLCFGNGKFITVSKSQYAPKAYYSEDGVTWTEFTIPDAGWSAITYGADKFIMVSDKSYRSYSASDASACIETSSVYTFDENPTTSSQIYSAPEVTSTLTITSVGTGTITLSDSNIYTYNSNGNDYSYYTVGEAYPNYICLIENVGIKKGTTTIATATTVKQTYDATSTDAISGVGVAQAFVRPTS